MFPLCGRLLFSLSPRMELETPMMTTPSSTIKNEVHVLMDVQIETLGQRAPLTPSQLQEFHCRFEKISTLYQELDRIGARSVIERQLRRVA